MGTFFQKNRSTWQALMGMPGSIVYLRQQLMDSNGGGILVTKLFCHELTAFVGEEPDLNGESV